MGWNTPSTLFFSLTSQVFHLFLDVLYSDKLHSEKETRSVDNHDGTQTIFFKPVRSGPYQIEVDVVSKEGDSVKVKGSPFKVHLTIKQPSKADYFSIVEVLLY